MAKSALLNNALNSGSCISLGGVLIAIGTWFKLALDSTLAIVLPESVLLFTSYVTCKVS